MSDPAAVGRALRALGLTERAARACFGVHCVGHAPLRANAMSGPGENPTPATIAPWLLIAGRAFGEATVRRAFGDTLDDLVELGIVRIEGGRAIANAAVLPIGEALAVSDRFDNLKPAVMFPDDSAFHLIGALGRRRVGTWLDLGTGNAIAPLAARGRADRIRATDLSAAAIARAQLGAALSAMGDIELAVADLADGAEAAAPWDLITFNAPIPAELGAAARDCAYTASPVGARVLERFWDAAARLVATDGEVIVHSVCIDPPPELGGSFAIARYTPPQARIPFGVTSWWPGGPDERITARVTLTRELPHVGREQLRP